MDNVTKLELARDNRPTSDISLELFDEKVAGMRETIEEHPDSGFILITYRRESRGAMSSNIDYALVDPMDAYALPEFVKARIINLRDKRD